MSNHTPEPWKYEKELSAGCDEWLISMDAGDRGRGICIAETRPGSVAGGQANAHRIVTCVNACAGMEDPAAEIAELKRQRDELLRDMQDVLDMLINQPHAVTAANQAEDMLRLSIGTAKHRVKGSAKNHLPDTAKMVPDGWQFAPKVPTREMIEQGNAAMAYDCCSGDASDAYQAMLAAAPKPEGGAA